MAIKDTNEDQAASTAQQETSSFNGNRNNQQSNSGDERGYSFTGLSKLTRVGLSRKPASEALSKFHKTVSEMLKEKAEQGFEIRLIPIEKEQTPNLSVSVLIVAVRDKQNLNFGVAYHTLVLEATSDIIPTKTELFAGQTIEIFRVVGDANEEVMKSTVLGYIEKEFPQEAARIAGSCVVQKDFNVDDKVALHRLMANAVFSCTSELETCPQNKAFIDINLVNARNDATLSVRTQFGQPQSDDATGLPLRTDIVMEFTAQPPQNQQNQQQTTDRVAPIARVGGFLDLYWDPIAAPQNPYAYAEVNQQTFQRYGVRFVATELESTEISTIPAQLLSLIPAVGLREGNAWIQGFRTKDFATSEVNLHDIGAIGLEVNFENNANNIGMRVDTHADKFKPEQLGMLVKATIRPGLAISLDVPECGAQTWYNEVFSAAAGGNARANAAIIKAANELTNGNFGKYFNQNSRIATDEFNRVHMGYYTNARGERADIRDIDYLAVLNVVGQQDPSAIRAWSDSYACTNIPLNKRLYDRKRIIQSICSNAVFTGFARRVTFEAAFIEALVKGCTEAGLAIKPVSSYADLGNYERARSQFSSSTLMAPESTGIFRSNYGQQTQRMGAGNQYSKW